MDRASVETALQEMIDEVGAARDNLGKGEEIGLADIQTRIQEVCNAAVALPKEDAVAVAPLLTTLRNDLTELSAALGMVMDRLGEDAAGEAGESAAEVANAPESTDRTP